MAVAIYGMVVSPSQMSGDSALYVFITEQPMVNLKGLYNIMQLSRCLLTHYRRTLQWQLEFLLPNVYFFSENGFPILLVTIWASEHIIESVLTQNTAISSYMDPQNWNLSRKKLDLQIFVKPPDPPPPLCASYWSRAPLAKSPTSKLHSNSPWETISQTTNEEHEYSRNTEAPTPPSSLNSTYRPHRPQSTLSSAASPSSCNLSSSINFSR